jgi:RNA polymerase sigma-70 factor, ECF subfamily
VSELGEEFPEVLRAAAAGDRAAFARLWHSAHPGLLRYLAVVSVADAEDVASETWMKAMRGLSSFTGSETAFRGWLAVIARNHLTDHWRRAARKPEQLQAQIDEHALLTERDTAELAEERLSTQRALQLIASLPPQTAEMVALRIILGLEVAQVAQIVNRTPGAVRVAVHRGLRTLAAQLDTNAATPGPL